jgi:hypothetical protein
MYANGEAVPSNDEGPDVHGFGGEHVECVLRETTIKAATLVGDSLGWRREPPT